MGGHVSYPIEYYENTKPFSSAYYAALMQQNALQQSSPLTTIGQLLGAVSMPTFDGSKPIVVCGGEAKEAKDMDAAQALAESLAHSKSADAYILKPVRKVAPKRDVVTMDIP